MASKTRTILRRRPKGQGDRAKTGRKVATYPPKGSNTHPAGPLTGTSAESTKAVLVPLRLGVPGGVKDDLEDIVVVLGLYPSVSELARTVLLKERDRRLGELRRMKKEAEQST